MTTVILLLILLVGLQVDTWKSDDILQNFLAPSLNEKFYQFNSINFKDLHVLYKNKFNRPSVSPTEEKVRFDAFSDTIDAILEHNQKNDKTYTIALNKFADWTLEELNNLHGLKIPTGEISITNAKPNQRFLTLSGEKVQGKTITIPISYDLTKLFVTGTNTPFLRPVKYQGRCGSCYAFAFITLLEVQYARQLKSGTDLSEQQMIDCSTLDYGCDGGSFLNTFQYLSNNSWQVNSGISYPYTQKAGKCAFKSVGGGGVKFGSLFYQRLPANSAYSMQQALIDYGPLYTSHFAGDTTTATYKSILRKFTLYRTGIFQPTECPTSNMNHAVVIVGYGVDSETGIPYWKVRNSWGKNWGEDGYFRIRRGVNMCGIESRAFYIAKPA